MSLFWTMITCGKEPGVSICKKLRPGVQPLSLAALPESEEIRHYSIVDSDGNAISVTTIINASYGSKVFVQGAAFLLNNEMDDFSSKPGVPMKN